MRILVLSLADEPFWPIAEISNYNKQAYCDLHGYDFACGTKKIWDDYPASWSKIPATKIWARDYGYDYIFWSDADSLVMNMSLNLEDLIRVAGKKSLIAHSNHDGLNFGQFIIRADEWALGLLEQVESMRYQFRDHKWWEQGALQEILKGQEEDKVYFAGPWFNRMVVTGDGPLEKTLAEINAVRQPDDFILHFPAIPMERRLEAMKIYAAESK